MPDCPWSAAPPPDCNPDPVPDQGWLDAAQAVLAQITGYQFGCCEQTFTAWHGNSCTSGWWSLYFGFGWWPGVVDNRPLVQRALDCSGFGNSTTILLPDDFTATAVSAGSEIGAAVIGGASIGELVVWAQVGSLLTSPTPFPNPVEITGTSGKCPPEILLWATYVLAQQLALAACGDSACQLPENVTSVSRDGVTISVVDDWSALLQGKTGIRWIDLVVQLYGKNSNSGAEILVPGGCEPKWQLR